MPHDLFELRQYPAASAGRDHSRAGQRTGFATHRNHARFLPPIGRSIGAGGQGGRVLTGSSPLPPAGLPMLPLEPVFRSGAGVVVLRRLARAIHSCTESLPDPYMVYSTCAGRLSFCYNRRGWDGYRRNAADCARLSFCYNYRAHKQLKNKTFLPSQQLKKAPAGRAKACSAGVFSRRKP